MPENTRLPLTPPHWMRESTVPYVGLLLISVMLGAWLNYLGDRLNPGEWLLKGQSMGIVIPILGFPVVILLWWISRSRVPRDPWVSAVLIGLIIAWPLHIWIAKAHGDQLPHTVWIYGPALVLLLIKPPSSEECFRAVQWFAWLASLLIVVTWALERAHVIPVFDIPVYVAAFDQERYWIPIGEILGIDGRWPGPFGGNSRTGFVGVAIVLIAVHVIRRRHLASSVLLLAVGGLTVLACASRGAFLALAVGLLIYAAFTRRGWIARIPGKLRIGIAGLLLATAAIAMLMSPAGSAGRADSIWPAFLDLWSTSPWVGVGQVGILADPQAGISMEAHNLILQEGTRFGVVGLVIQFAPLMLGVALSIVAAFRGRPWPLALIASFATASFFDAFVDGWLSMSTYILLLVLAILASRPSSEQGAVERSSEGSGAVQG